MTVKIEFYSMLRDMVGADELELSIPDGSTIEILLSRLYALHPRLAEWDGRLLVAAGLDYVDRTHVVQIGEVVSVMPPVQGG